MFFWLCGLKGSGFWVWGLGSSFKGTSENEVSVSSVWRPCEKPRTFKEHQSDTIEELPFHDLCPLSHEPPASLPCQVGCCPGFPVGPPFLGWLDVRGLGGGAWVHKAKPKMDAEIQVAGWVKWDFLGRGPRLSLGSLGYLSPLPEAVLLSSNPPTRPKPA